ncbi:uncharacterized protein LOC110050530 [Orbicella faveolata]|uniref:uncharacterized protein LOC110050530 n=1 Tax=Orbicella faveolata TaxID=48498 RepID=UPI0009E56E72|nr:uncharacterized protein LOC110050530 [Orbicella faveolata]
MDLCNCCTKCLRVNGQTCGGTGYIIGRCAKGLKCSLTSMSRRNPVGHCISLLKPTVAPVQKLLTNKVVIDEANLEQQSNFPRQNIPGHPVSKMAENDIHPKQENIIIPENYTKHSPHSSEMESTNSPKIDNGTAMINATHMHDQTHQKKPNRAANMEDSLSEVGPAVIFVAVSGAVFLCLIGLLFLPISPKANRAQNSQTGS